MKKFFTLLFLVVTVFFLTSSHKKISVVKKNYEGIARWTGSVTMEQITIFSNPAMTGKAEKKLVTTFVDALPTMYRDEGGTDLNFTDDKGKGSYSFHSEITDITGRKCVTDCNGSGTAALHTVVVNESDRTYDIEVIGPGCKGTTCDENGAIKEYNDNDDDITITEPLGTNINSLDGSTTGTAKDPNGWSTMTTTISWHLTRSPDDVELIVTPDNYDNWLPVPGKNEMMKGSVMTINLKIQGKNGKPLKSRAESFELTLNNTSIEPGITINYPAEPDVKQLPDLRFLPLANLESVDEDQFISVGSVDGTTGKAFIGSYDGGGWTTLTAEAVLKDGRHIQGRLLVPTGETAVRIPKRDPKSHIAESWLKANGNPGELDDKENSKGNSNDGDGLTAYEEYRGVISEGKFKRLDPKKKEVGILASERDFALFNEGLSWFKNASNLQPVRFDFDKDEIRFDGKLNSNNNTDHTYDQYAIYILNGGAGGGGTLGITYTKTNAPDIPAQIIGVVIDWSAIQSAYQRRINEAKPSTPKFTLQEYLAQTIAHELGHSVNVWHHGDDIRFNYDARTQTWPSYHPMAGDSIFDRNGNLITKRPYPLDDVGGPNGTVEGGDISCLMNYYPYYSWGITRGANGAYVFYQEPLLRLGRMFCTSGSGTGINATKFYFGNADPSRGNCFRQIKLK
jgi:hypothetical protein